MLFQLQTTLPQSPLPQPPLPQPSQQQLQPQPPQPQLQPPTTKEFVMDVMAPFLVNNKLRCR